MGYPIRIILAIFVLQVTQILPTKFQVEWHFGSGEDVRQIFKIAAMTTNLDF